ncbi:TIGR00341 family protein [Cellulomonas sp. JH27-2]|uniref:TIGR00341 family protein n=1 Tax=Cellulomonas sp. JH27-2 TaxID=2774139 RepID=UPI0017851632|nr:TIGR00341 family protein [Cellulomonas sp. JH27-2]MBD8057896.1 TIGR00341 family protein [Cellulomonas sp. JH27-2]
MAKHPLQAVLPDRQRRTLDELTADLDLSHGDRQSKRSAFWTMLVLSAVIASAGVLSDSTATVIGAMIIAPLSTPIMGVALGLAKGSRTAILSAARFVVLGALLVIAVGVVFSLVIPSTTNLLTNSQISGRTSPGLLDLVAAIATGFAGAIALARRDVAAVLPGVAIAISLVPPLAVVGICFGQGAFGLGFGALTLFLSNFLALVLAGTLVYATTGYTAEAEERRDGPRRRTYLTIGILFTLVALPLVLNTVGNYVLALYTNRVQAAADAWVSQVPGAEITGVTLQGDTIHIEVRTPGDLPAGDDLLTALDGRVPSGIGVVVDSSRGESVDVGVVGS